MGAGKERSTLGFIQMKLALKENRHHISEAPSFTFSHVGPTLPRSMQQLTEVRSLEVTQRKSRPFPFFPIIPHQEAAQREDSQAERGKHQDWPTDISEASSNSFES